MSNKVLMQNDLFPRDSVSWQSLWLEVSPECHLSCPYCFSKSPEICTDIPKPMDWDIYENRVLRPFAEHGGGDKWLGIPGAGEPFHNANINLTRRILDLSHELDFKEVTIFTSGDLIDEELAKELHGYSKLKIMVKWNSLDAKIQNRLVGDDREEYFARRQDSWELLLSKFKSDKDRKRLGIVTSILTSNWQELPVLLRKAREEWRVCFDCDTILPKGRGRHCSEWPTHRMIRETVQAMQKVDRNLGFEWQPSGAYIGCSCNRYLHHLYISYQGLVYPCLGTCNLSLGNVHNDDVGKIWGGSKRQKIAQRRITGACAVCTRYRRGNCTSCFGRNKARLDNADELLSEGYFHTSPCELFVPELSVALDFSSKLIRRVLSNSLIISKHLQQTLECIWDVAYFPIDNDAILDAELQKDTVIPSDSYDNGETKKGLAPDRWARLKGLPRLLSDNAPIAIRQIIENENDSRIYFSPEGFPLKGDWDDDRIWHCTDIDASEIIGETGIKWLHDIGLLNHDCTLKVDISSELTTVLAAHKPSCKPSDIKNHWSLFGVLKSGKHIKHDPHTNPDDVNCKKIVHFSLQHEKTGNCINLDLCWASKFVQLKDVPLKHSYFDSWPSTQFPLGLKDESESYITTILPSLLLPLTSQVIESHEDESQPYWILWLFYDPCKNYYFRRLIDCRGLSRYDADTFALQLLYMWPESGPDTNECFTQLGLNPIWFDENILNLSDVLRDPIVDYEVHTDTKIGPELELMDNCFAVGCVIDKLDEEIKGLLDVVRSSGLSNEDMDFLTNLSIHHIPLERRETYEKFCACLKKMSECLVNRRSEQMAEVYNMLPKSLRDSIETSICDSTGGNISDTSKVHRRTLNYFVFLGALRELGARYYYVGQTLTHNLMPEVPGSHRRENWRMTPSGFIVASQEPLADSLKSDLRLVYSTVMAPVIEQYAKWTSDYEIERAEVVRNLPCLQRLPKHYIASLENNTLMPDESWLDKEVKKKIENELDPQKHDTDLKWLRRLPKADLHVHLGPAIPIEVLYDLSAISVYRWTKDKGEIKKLEEVSNTLTSIIKQAVNNIQERNVDSSEMITDDLFKEAIVSNARSLLGNDSIHSINSMLEVLSATTGVADEKCACILNVHLGFLVRRNWESWEKYLEKRISTLVEFSGYLDELEKADVILKPTDILDRSKHLVAQAYLRPSGYVLKNVLDRYRDGFAKLSEDMNDALKKIKLGTSTFEKIKWDKSWGDPLSNILSMPRKFTAKAIGLGRYIDSSSLTGSAVLQFYETLILALIETVKCAAITDAVRYMEIKLSPRGLVGKRTGYEDITICTALLSLSFVSLRAFENLLKKGFFWLPKHTDDSTPFILANIVIAGKRHDNHSALRATVQQAVDSRDLYLTASRQLAENQETTFKNKNRKDNGIQDVIHGIFTRSDVNLIVPRVVGVDLVGRERGIKHSDLSESMMEAFEKCILLTIHAGEDENEKSIWDAIYSLHTQRIGHGLRMEASSNLGNLIRDRRIPVELCPVSNHFTNGFFLQGLSQYVFDDYRQKYLTLTIATDDPWISHRLGPNRTPPCYPLSDEYLALPLLFRKREQENQKQDYPLKLGEVSRLDVLRLIYNGFDNAFLPTRDREAILAFADIETFYVISSFDLRYRIFEANLGK